jgi:hypothetical protein
MSYDEPRHTNAVVHATDAFIANFMKQTPPAVMELEPMDAHLQPKPPGPARPLPFSYLNAEMERQL